MAPGPSPTIPRVEDGGKPEKGDEEKDESFLYKHGGKVALGA